MLLSIGALLVLAAVASAVSLPQKRHWYDDSDVDGLQLLTDEKRISSSSAAAARKSVRSSGSAKVIEHGKRFGDDGESDEFDSLGEIGQQDDFQLWIPADMRAIQLNSKKRSVAAAKHRQTKKNYGDDDTIEACDETTANAQSLDAYCRRDRASKICQGHGRCVCGKCDCYPIVVQYPHRRYSGRFCECNDFSCPYYRKQLCGGPGRGRCVCGECTCQEGFTGPSCECATTTSSSTCIAKNGKICNDMGSCVCGTCQCTAENSEGPTCEDFPKSEPQAVQRPGRFMTAIGLGSYGSYGGGSSSHYSNSDDDGLQL